MKILVITTEPVPLPNLVPTGAGIRAWALAQGLNHHHFEVEIGMAADALKGLSPAEVREVLPDISLGRRCHILDQSHDKQPVRSFAVERSDLTAFVRERRPDVLVMQHWGLMDRLAEVNCPIAIDLAGPHLLERMYWGSLKTHEDYEQKLAALRRADFLTCSGQMQRAYFLGFAMQAGYKVTDPDVLPVIHYSLSPELPEPRQHDPALFVYTGGFSALAKSGGGNPRAAGDV